MFLFKVIVVVALVGAPALAGLTKGGLEQQRDEQQQQQIREEPASQQQVLTKVEDSSQDRKLPAARLEAKGSLGDEKKPLEVIKIEQERPQQQQQQTEEHESSKTAPESQVEQVVREDTKRATFAPPIQQQQQQQQQQRDETAQLEEPRAEQVQIKQELELPKQEEFKGAEIRQLEHVKRQPEVLLRSAPEVGRLRSSWSTKESIDRRPLAAGGEPLRSEHREENSRPLPPVKTYAKAYNQEAPKLYTLGRFVGANSQPDYSSSQSYGYPYYQPASYGYSQPPYGYYSQPASSYGSPYYRGYQSSYTTGGSYTRYVAQPQTLSYPGAQRQPVYVREYYLPASTGSYYQPASYSSSYPQAPSSSYRLHYSSAESQPIKSRRVAATSLDEHTSVADE